ncbi:hypothetical protein RND81_02G245500 [Saponaria officinalis]|uniref:DC1 domain-containing protein n=1 Tax=Saponaria officinalis TaxID=3572 RepID=A0AAW1MZC5_SAPOF
MFKLSRRTKTNDKMDAMMCTHGTVTRVEFDDRFSFSCRECHEMGYGTCYRCSNGCDHQLHEECWRASSEAFFSFFGRQPFHLQRQQRPNITDKFCTACGMAVTGLMYASTFDNGITIFLHPTCIKLPHRIEIDDGGGDMDRFSLTRQLRSLRCLYCDRTTLEGPINGWAYVSADQQSACHVKCLKNRLYEDWIRYVFPEEPQGASNDPWWHRICGDPNYDQCLKPRVGSSSNSSSQRQQPYDNAARPGYDHCLFPRVVSSSYSSTSRSAGSSQGQKSYHNAARPGYDRGLDLWVVPSTYSSKSRTAAASQGQRNSTALTVTMTAERRRQILWKLSKVAFRILLNVAIGLLLPMLVA